MPSGTSGIGSSTTANVGIGVNNPSEKLQINGAVRGNVSGALKVSTGNGYIDIGPQNTSWAHIYTDRPSFIFNKPVYAITGEFCSYSSTNLIFKTNTTTRMLINNSNGFVGIGTTNPSATLTVNGTVKAEKVEVVTDVPASDFVFEQNYTLRDLNELENYIFSYKHLPEIPSAEEFKTNGYSVGQMDDLLLRKIEELTLYLIDQNKLIQELQSKVEQLENQ